MRKRDLVRALAEEVRYRMWVEHRLYVAENALEQAAMFIARLRKEATQREGTPTSTRN